MAKRIKLDDRELPDYTKGEEIFNMVSHIVGGALGIAAMVLCIIMAAKHGSAIGVISSIIYGITLIDLYAMSSIYHGLKPGKAKKVMQVLDHCTIYFLIAGSYTPVLLVAMMPKYPVIAWVLFGIVWGCAVVACTLTAIDLKKYNVFSMICYLAMGWCIIFFIRRINRIQKVTVRADCKCRRVVVVSENVIQTDCTYFFTWRIIRWCRKNISFSEIWFLWVRSVS